MALKLLPLAVQSKFSASTQINNFKTAIEEMVYNAFDAGSTCIAIRIHIQENFIQVVDNGHGVAKNDFNLLGQRHFTSKYEDSITSKSNHKYGRFGQALANIIEVSESVKITSRCKNSGEAFIKHFYKGKSQNCLVTTSRPSIGTTVEVKGFLYNMTIQKKAIKSLQELQRIKTFLEQMSLVHCNTSISLRDNTDNEIIFKIHKNRDIYLTFSSLMGIDKSSFQELHVEKNQYKVMGYIQKSDTQSHGYQWIYVNKRFIDYSNLHKIVNQTLIKLVPTKKITKVKNHNNEEDRALINNKLHDYFIFITCPCHDFDIISNPKQLMLEFKNWKHIEKLLEKLITFFAGGTNLVNKGEMPIEKMKINMADVKDTRIQVKQIMNKVLGSQNKKNNGSQLHNGVKGKVIKRKLKKNIKEKFAKLKPNDEIKNSIQRHEFAEVFKQNDEPFKNDCCNDKYHNTASFKIPNRKPLKNEISVNANKQKKHVCKTKVQKANREIVNKDPVILKFEKESGEVHKRCRILAKKAKKLLDFKKKRKCKIFTNEIVQYSSVVTDNKSVSVRKQIDEVIIHEYLPLPPQKSKVNKREYCAHDIMKSYDLIHPVTNIVNNQTYDYKIRQIRPKANIPAFVNVDDFQGIDERDLNIPRLTYESHSYNRAFQVHGTQENSFENNNCHQFTRKISRENSASPEKRKKENSSANMKNYNKKFKLLSNKTKDCKTSNFVFTDTSQSSYSIHFTETESKSRIDKTQNIAPNIPNNGGTPPLNDETHNGTTYTIIDTDNVLNKVDDSTRGTVNDGENIHGTYDVTVSGANRHLQEISSQSIDRQHSLNGIENSITLENNNFNVVFVSNSQQSEYHSELNAKEGIDPLRICETILEDHSSGEYNFIFDSINNVVELNDCEHPLINVYKNDIIHGIDNWSKFDGSGSHNMAFKDFNIKSRRRFIPKGLSPIFKNCNSKKVCDYKFDEDYFEGNLYNNFAQDVQINAETFEPTIQNVKELASKDIERVTSKLNRQNTSLTFNGEAIKGAQVLGQVDHKFIATKIKDKRNDEQDYLVLFDQHAVHERIRLETNMAEYFNGHQWKSASLDGISLHLNKDDVVYLHNCKDKFVRLGLEWQIVNDTEVTVTAIPEAILGKNLRQVDIVLKSVKGLIKEVISMIKEQGGCVSLYPKSIMDLVFSEACRYAIMFGDALSKGECRSLLNALSKCKTPFQCAHGRPVMAVLTNIKAEDRAYKMVKTNAHVDNNSTLNIGNSKFYAKETDLNKSKLYESSAVRQIAEYK